MENRDAVMCWVGVDWGGKEHAVCVLDSQGVVMSRLRVKHSPQGLATLVEWLRNFGPIGGVAVESTRNLVVHALSAANFTVYPINPKLSCQWRKAWSVSEAKDDERDAEVLADGLMHRYEHLQPLLPDTEIARELALLCEDEVRLINDRTCLVQKLEDTLKQYYPAALEWFGDWATPNAWAFVLKFSTPAALAKASRQKVYGFIKAHRLKYTPARRTLIESRSNATDWPCDEATIRAKSLLAVTLAKQLEGLERSLKKYRKRIEALFNKHADSPIFESLPGTGPKLAPRLSASFGSNRSRFDSARAVQQLSGTAPVTHQSGKRKHVTIRRACQKGFRATLYHFAWHSKRRSAWAKACYDLAKERGQSHSQALRVLANKWNKIIYRMWQTGETYDEQRYIDQLIRKRSPIAQKMGLLKTGTQCG